MRGKGQREGLEGYTMAHEHWNKVSRREARVWRLGSERASEE